MLLKLTKIMFLLCLLSNQACLLLLRGQGWVKFSSPDGNFSIQFPSTPTEKSAEAETEFGKAQSRRFTSSYKDGVFIAGYADYTRELTIADPKKYFEIFRDEMLKKMEAQLISEKPLLMKNFPGDEFVMKLVSENEHQIVYTHVYPVKTRLYQLVVVIREDQASKPDVKNDLAKFFDSFDFTPPPTGK